MIKNLTRLVLASLILGFSHIAQAQENIAKIGIFALASKNVSLKYERVLNEKSSANLNLSFRIPGGLPLGINLADVLETEITDEAKLNSFNIAPEYRIYTKGDAPRGFYVAPYIQYSSAGIKYSGIVESFATDSKINYSNIGAGIQLGVQWLIKDKLSVDWTFLGIGIGNHRIKARYESDDPGIDFQDIIADIEAELDGIPIIGDRFNFESGADFAEGSVRAILPLFRGGLTFGYAF